MRSLKCVGQASLSFPFESYRWNYRYRYCRSTPRFPTPPGEVQSKAKSCIPSSTTLAKINSLIPPTTRALSCDSGTCSDCDDGCAVWRFPSPFYFYCNVGSYCRDDGQQGEKEGRSIIIFFCSFQCTTNKHYYYHKGQRCSCVELTVFNYTLLRLEPEGCMQPPPNVL